ncbi:hypothetical protein D9C73_004603 [Collichthys lucidus]|uniref:Uncharacterized protein n=1 Tax=Collichthys lucidus TaxID=240159 RepID=A0A4U5U856_COLLU|nr:hypothetical protein D9C73_004603 [Collichthys lucidus]
MKITPYEAAGDGPHLSPPADFLGADSSRCVNITSSSCICDLSLLDTRALSSLSVAFIISEVGVVEVSPAELKKPTRHFEENELLELSPAKRDRHRSEVSRGDEQLSTSGVLF